MPQSEGLGDELKSVRMAHLSSRGMQLILTALRGLKVSIAATFFHHRLRQNRRLRLHVRINERRNGDTGIVAGILMEIK